MKTKAYRLCDNRSGISCDIKTGKKGTLTVLYTDEDGNSRRRAIRHCPNQPSIFMDEQDQFAVVKPIVFKFGRLEVPGDQPLTQEFLDKHPSNAANGGIWFEPVDEAMEAGEDNKNEESIIDAKYLVRKLAKDKDGGGLDILTAVVAVKEGNIDTAIAMSTEEIKRYLYNAIEESIDFFTDEDGKVTVFDDADILRKYTILKAIKSGIVIKSVDLKSLMWADTKKVFVTAPSGVDNLQYFADFLTTEEGALVLTEIKKRS